MMTGLTAEMLAGLAGAGDGDEEAVADEELAAPEAPAADDDGAGDAGGAGAFFLATDARSTSVPSSREILILVALGRGVNVEAFTCKLPPAPPATDDTEDDGGWKDGAPGVNDRVDMDGVPGADG